MKTTVAESRTRMRRRYGERKPGRLLPTERERLAARAAADDAEAFDALVRAYRPMLVTYVSMQLGDSYGAEDIVQETLLRAWRFRRDYVVGPNSSWLRWCKKIADRLLVDAWRAEARLDCVLESELERRDPSEPSGDGSPFVAVPDPRPRADELLILRERLRVVEDAIASLSPTQRRILEWRIDGRGLREIAERIGLPRSTVKMYLWRARRRIAAAVEAAGLGSRGGGL